MTHKSEFFVIDKHMRDNWLALFEEMKINRKHGPQSLAAWFDGEEELIDQSIFELKSLVEYEECYLVNKETEE